MASGWISKLARLAIYKRDNYTCAYCNGTCCHYNDRTDNYSYATLDHVVSRITLATLVSSIKEFKAALKDAKNLITVCNKCNASKNDTDLETWCNATNRNYSEIKAEIERRIA